MPLSRRLPMPGGAAHIAVLLLVPMLLLAACSGGGDIVPPPPPTSPGPQPVGPITATVSSCSKPFSQGQTKLIVAFRMPAGDLPLHFKNAFRVAASMGASPAPISAGTASPQPGTGQDVLTMTGPVFDRITFAHAKLEADGEQTVRAPSLSALAGRSFRGPFGKARIVSVQTHGNKVVVQLVSPRTPAKDVENNGPQTSTLDVGSQTLTPAPSTAIPKGRQYVNKLAFTGTSPMNGPATLKVSSWSLLDLAPLTVVVPASC
jgi:hypothetical protein